MYYFVLQVIFAGNSWNTWLFNKTTESNILTVIHTHKYIYIDIYIEIVIIEYCFLVTFIINLLFNDKIFQKTIYSFEYIISSIVKIHVCISI